MVLAMLIDNYATSDKEVKIAEKDIFFCGFAVLTAAI